jgi:hypothetical protein
MDLEDVSDVYTASIFMVEVCKECELLCMYRILFQRATKMGRENEEWCPLFWAGATVNRENCAAGPCLVRAVKFTVPVVPDGTNFSLLHSLRLVF